MKIIRGNSYCKVEDATVAQEQHLTESLTYTDQEAYMELQMSRQKLQLAIYRKNQKMVWGMRKKIEELQSRIEVCLYKNNRFPSGLLDLVKDILKDQNINYTIEDTRVKPKSSLKLPWKNPNGHSDRYYQADMVELAVKHHRGVFESAVGTGKTRVLQRIIKELEVPTLVIAPSADLKHQIIDTLEEVFGARYIEEVTTAKAKKARRWKPIRVATVQTLASLVKNGLLEPVMEDVKMICIDEVHHAGARSYTDLLPYFDEVYYRFGFTGTFLRNDSKTLDMWGFLSNVLYKYPAGKAVSEGYLTPLQVLVHDVRGTKSAKYPTEYNKNYCGGAPILDKIAQIVEIIPNNNQILILVKQKEAGGKLIHEHLASLGVPNTYISGDDKKEIIKKALKDFNEKTIRILIGSTIIGEGIDIRSTDHLIMAQGGKSEIAITQATGRAVRLFPGKVTAVVHDFNFQGTKYLQDHLVSRIKVYEKNFEADISVV